MNIYHTLDESTEEFYKNEIKKAVAEEKAKRKEAVAEEKAKSKEAVAKARAEEKAKIEEAVAKASKKSQDETYARLIKNGCSKKFAYQMAYDVE